GGLPKDKGTWPFYCRYGVGSGETVPTKAIKNCEPGRSAPFGLYDMAGNVAEWCDSPFVPYAEQKAFDDKDNGLNRVVRGGSFKENSIANCRAAIREGFGQDEAPEHVGFRCVKPVIAAK